jgi:hypothetical protein
MQAADEACQPLLANAIGDREPPSAEEIQEQQDQALAFAQCMRDRGYDWPDPTFEDGGRMTQSLGDDIDTSDPDFQTDQQECAQDSGMDGFIGGGPAGAAPGSGGSTSGGAGDGGGNLVIQGGGQ